MIPPALVQALVAEKRRAAEPYACCNGAWCRAEYRPK